MAYVLKTILSNRRNYGSARDTSKIKYIVIHYTANNGDTATGNGNYFKNNVVKASAHLFVDSTTVVQSVPDNYVAWSVGGKSYANCAATGGAKYYGVVTNTNSISIEICDEHRDNRLYPSEATIANALELTRALMKKYSVPVSHVIRHFDVTGKLCPAYWCGNTEKNKLWLTAFRNKLNPDTLFPLKSGDSGEAVAQLQKLLNAQGLQLVVDGIFGPATLTAVKLFQTKRGLKVDGCVDAVTWETLKAPVQSTETKEVNTMYKYVRDTPPWAQATFTKLVEKGYLTGVEVLTPNNVADTVINVSEEFCRIMVVLDRAGLFN